ncbi:hypothetical protein P2W68_06460 [Chryseobacterium arthrosphaerae]|uniref:hypothetical protein n=1 Tax=Chryseobacterium arthrosphaerae TaxID=651561 RepID=UPI0023E0DE51|nr:hypothetical protein [Chryseobacterium arthrosphaerae]WES99253.1 hypothetical protein P2W68_06460 [Chryseobacterium arthrosphaerae]
MRKIINLFCLIIPFFYSSQEIEIIDVKYSPLLKYISFYHIDSKKYDEYTTRNNLSLITNSFIDFSRVKKQKGEKVFKVLKKDTIVNNDIDIPLKSIIDSKNHIKIPAEITHYMDNSKIEKKQLKKGEKYDILNITEKNVIFIVVKMTKAYFNKNGHNLILSGNPNDKIIVYRPLTGADDFLIEKLSETLISNK